MVDLCLLLSDFELRLLKLLFLLRILDHELWHFGPHFMVGLFHFLAFGNLSIQLLLLISQLVIELWNYLFSVPFPGMVAFPLDLVSIKPLALHLLDISGRFRKVVIRKQVKVKSCTLIYYLRLYSIVLGFWKFRIRLNYSRKICEVWNYWLFTWNSCLDSWKGAIFACLVDWGPQGG